MKLSILQQNVYGTEEPKVDVDTGWEGLEAYAPLFTLRIRGGGRLLSAQNELSRVLLAR